MLPTGSNHRINVKCFSVIIIIRSHLVKVHLHQRSFHREWKSSRVRSIRWAKRGILRIYPINVGCNWFNDYMIEQRHWKQSPMKERVPVKTNSRRYSRSRPVLRKVCSDRSRGRVETVRRHGIQRNWIRTNKWSPWSTIIPICCPWTTKTRSLNDSTNVQRVFSVRWGRRISTDLPKKWPSQPINGPWPISAVTFLVAFFFFFLMK